jgi:16S rRNA (guanine527-N7)-methyltransferase
MQWLLMDSNTKKTRYIRQALLELKPDNIEIAETRIEDYPPNEGFSDIISRALMPARDFCAHCLPHLQPQGRILLMKSKSAAEEIAALDSELYQLQSHSLQVPGVDAERLVLIIERRQ